MLTNLYDDIQGILLQKLNSTDLIVLCHVNKKYYGLVSDYGKINNINRKLICDEIARYGYLEVLKWARENGCEWDSYTCHNAAENGHLEVLKWARENGCVWNSITCDYAAKNGNLEILKWAIENGCRMGPDICGVAYSYGHFEVIKWIKEIGIKHYHKKPKKN
jgi:hypothetical protein